ncbi:MAG: hypothetical protein IPL61_27550 [Myxococcales bacterium]|nr:hypothetical protein [Myxococcales bacterium]
MRMGRLLGIAVMVVLGCGNDEARPIDAAVDALDASGSACGVLPDPGGCQFVEESLDACPSVQEACGSLCDAVPKCCYCSGTLWLVLEIDCARCGDGGSPIEDAREADASFAP